MVHKAINENRLVTVKALQGMGKASVVNKLGFEFQERKRFHYGVMHIDLQEPGKSFATLVLRKMRESAAWNLLDQLRDIRGSLRKRNEQLERDKHEDLGPKKSHRRQVSSASKISPHSQHNSSADGQRRERDADLICLTTLLGDKDMEILIIVKTSTAVRSNYRFRNDVSEILRRCRHVTILMTCRIDHDDTQVTQEEKIIELKKLEDH